MRSSRDRFPQSQFSLMIRALRKHFQDCPLGALALCEDVEVSLCRLVLEPWRVAHPSESSFKLPLGLILL